MLKAYYRHKRQELYAYTFGFSLFACTVLCTGMVFLNMGPVILGTEMNTNGMVEYLCLGAACENLHDFNW